MRIPPLTVITGPTASGKSSLALALAHQHDGEIVSADSMQVYRQLDIGTAKPSLVEQRQVAHHLIDIVEPSVTFSVAQFHRLAWQAIGDIQARKRLPLLVGGTMLYIKAVTAGYLFGAVQPDASLRRQLREQAQAQGTQALHQQLAQLDAEAAQRIHPHDLRRISRALEVHYATEETGTKKSKLAPPPQEAFIMALDWPREQLYARIEERVDGMLAAGLVAEVQQLYQLGYADHLRRIGALGYREIGYYLEGQCTLTEAVRLLKRNTRRYAKRQLTWLRSFERIKWLKAGENRATEEIVAEASNFVQETQPAT